MVRKYLGHKDGIWEVACKRGQQPVIGTASAGKVIGMFIRGWWKQV